MRKYCKIFTTLWLFGAVFLLRAQESGELSGRIRDAEDRTALPGANVQISGTYLGAVSDEHGYFKIAHIPAGAYRINVSYIGYKSEQSDVLINAETENVISIDLQPSAIEMNQVIVTGSRQPEELARAAASVEVLSKSSIKRRNNFRIDEALLNVAGLTIVGENINIRGGAGYNRLGGSRSLVLLDGVPVLTSDLGTANWNIIPVTEIEHIEILKGAASSLYGSGALTGVINILTKQPSRSLKASFRQSAGVFDEPSVQKWKWTDKILYYHRIDGSISKSFGPVGVRLALSTHRSTGDRENGFFNRWYVTGKTVWRMPRSALTFFGSYSYEDRELFLQWMEQNRALRVPPPDQGNRYKLNGAVGYAVYERLFTPTFTGKVRISYNQQLVGLPFNITNAFTPALGFSGEVQFNWQPHEEHSLSFGVDYKLDRVESLYYGERRANGISPYVQEIWRLSRLLQIQAGMRFDTYTLVGDSVETQLSPKIGASYQPFYGTIIHLSYGRGFRAATVLERFITAGSKDFRALPNPTLQPERSTLIDLGIRQRFGKNVYLEAAVFSNYYENLIEPTLASDLTAQFKNYPKARIRGLETELTWQLWHDRLAVHATATWMDPEEIDKSTPLPYRPRFIGYLTPSMRLGPFLIETDYRYMSRIEKVAIYPLDERVPTKIWDLRCGYARKNWLFQIQVRNALNYNYTISERVLGEIRNFMVSMSVDF